MMSTLPTSNSHKEVVVLLHGIGHTKWNMFFIELALHKAGYKTLNITYPSLQHNLQTLSHILHQMLEKEHLWGGDRKVHFVTHSMGGLVTRYYLDRYRAEIPADQLGRVVMIAPPNGGSEVADILRYFPPYRWIFGPAGQELTTLSQNHNVAVDYELGIIAGTRGWPYVLGVLCIPGLHDGRVSVERTKHQAMKDHICVKATHSFISWKRAVHHQIIYFLRHGTFESAHE